MVDWFYGGVSFLKSVDAWSILFGGVKRFDGQWGIVLGVFNLDARGTEWASLHDNIVKATCQVISNVNS